ncbi:MAG: biotin carboxylase N-terminal domain-containing protein, partial [Bdellovibrionota bacterium]|nr:biotin carboxylase N-terminal domain-containing protein [Bdellovibrionota bacterium]
MNSKTTLRKIKKVLIANRGEIAVRIMETCRLMGIKTVSIYHLEEKELPHSLLGDESVCLGEGSLHETYLNGEKIVEVALAKGADAIHPGY